MGFGMSGKMSGDRVRRQVPQRDNVTAFLCPDNFNDNLSQPGGLFNMSIAEQSISEMIRPRNIRVIGHLERQVCG
jgi:hypothetical protein